MARRLYAAKPVSWKGTAELPQMPWQCPCAGLVLVIDLWAGIGGLTLAVMALGMRAIVVSAECDPDLTEAKGRLFPNIIQTTDVANITGKMFKEVMARRSFTAVLLGGGSPCQGNTSLNLHRKGLDDPRSQQPVHLKRIRDELRMLYPATPVFSFLENVASSPPPVVSAYTQLVEGAPVEVDAAIWGWTSRRRLFWLSGPAGGISRPERLQLPDGFTMQQKQGRLKMAKHDQKTWPSSPRFEMGYEAAFHPGDVVRGVATPFWPVHQRVCTSS